MIPKHFTFYELLAPHLQWKAAKRGLYNSNCHYLLLKKDECRSIFDLEGKKSQFAQYPAAQNSELIIQWPRLPNGLKGEEKKCKLWCSREFWWTSVALKQQPTKMLVLFDYSSSSKNCLKWMSVYLSVVSNRFGWKHIYQYMNLLSPSDYLVVLESLMEEPGQCVAARSAEGLCLPCQGPGLFCTHQTAAGSYWLLWCFYLV